jgi:two-component system, chemotaxis family, CheB/CheR fusion protein
MTQNFSLPELLRELAEQRGFDLRGYKRTTLERRFRKRMFQLNIGTYEDYAVYLRKNPEEISPLLTTILINVTEFFRDPPAWDFLRNEVLPRQFKRLKPGSSYRVWSAGCATGEEPYSAAMLLADYLGPQLPDYDIRIYATDFDDEELGKARRGEYSGRVLRRIQPEWRQKYFQGDSTLRLNREIRRLVIFGRSNLAQDAPISHVNLLLCRNVLIYFDAAAQRQILSRLHYALEPDGFLFLGRSESQLSNSKQFRRVNARWRIFQRLSAPSENRAPPSLPRQERNAMEDSRFGEELKRVRGQHQYMLETLRIGVIVLRADDTVEQNNTAALTVFGLPPASLTGRKIQDTEIFACNPELGGYLQASRMNHEAVRFHSRIEVGREQRLIEFILRPVLDKVEGRAGTLLLCEDISVRKKLQSTVGNLEAASEELQSTNEELETTNEELQSANEELETTNEELQSTNEELETTNEELQSLNEEMETTNQELEERGKELDQVNQVYLQTLETLGMPIMLIGEDGQIEFWNDMALRLFGFKSRPPMEVTLDHLPVPEALRKLMIRRHRSTLLKQQPVVARNWSVGGKTNPTADVHFRFIPWAGRGSSVLVMFNLHVPLNTRGEWPAAGKEGKPNKKSPKVAGPNQGKKKKAKSKRRG